MVDLILNATLGGAEARGLSIEEATVELTSTYLTNISVLPGSEYPLELAPASFTSVSALGVDDTVYVLYWEYILIYHHLYHQK